LPEDLTLISNLNDSVETDAWGALERELDQWRHDKKPATLWWRDDDAQHHTISLQRLIDLSTTTLTPLVLATIPEGVDACLPQYCKHAASITIVQHGWCHHNHAVPPQKKCEFGDQRNLEDVKDELRAGAGKLKTLFGDMFVPVLVPPWNRIGAKVAEHLKNFGYVGLSTFGPAQTVSGLPQANTHVDLINWRGDRGFIGTEPALRQICRHLEQRRCGQIPPDQVTGILTHHLVHNEDVCHFLEDFFLFTKQHPAAQWLTGVEVFKV